MGDEEEASPEAPRLCAEEAWKLLRSVTRNLFEFCGMKARWHRSQVHPFAHTCIGFQLTPYFGEDQDRLRTLTTRRIREYMHVWATLACCVRVEEKEGESFWGELLALSADSLTISDENMAYATVDDVAAFPRFVVRADNAVFPDVDSELGFFQTLLDWAPTPEATGRKFKRVMEKLKPYMQHDQSHGHDTKIDACLSFNSEFADDQGVTVVALENFLRNLPQTKQGTATCELPLDISVELNRPFAADENSYMARVHLIQTYEYVTCTNLMSLPPPNPVFRRPVRWLIGQTMLSALRDKPAPNGWHEDTIEAGMFEHCPVWIASCLCSVLRVAKPPIRSLVLPCLALRSQLPWIVFGLFHRSSAATIHQLSLPNCDVGANTMAQVNEVMTSLRPGRVLVALLDDISAIEGVEYPEIGTMARLKSRTLQVKWNIGTAVQPVGAVGEEMSLEHPDEPVFEVLALTPEWAGLMIPGLGFGWVKRTCVASIEKEEVTRSTHGVSMLAIGGRTFEHLASFFTHIGGPLQSLRLGFHGHTATDFPRCDLYEILRNCPKLMVLEANDFDWGQLVRAYTDGICHAKTLWAGMTFMPATVERIRPLLTMLTDNIHPGTTKLLNFKLSVLPQRSNMKGRPREDLTTLLTNMCVENSRLKVVYVLDTIRSIPTSVLHERLSSTQKSGPHPMLALVSVGAANAIGSSTAIATLVSSLDRGTLSTIYQFVGANRETDFAFFPGRSDLMEPVIDDGNLSEDSDLGEEIERGREPDEFVSEGEESDADVADIP